MLLGVVEILTRVIDELNFFDVIRVLAYEVLTDNHTENPTSVFLIEHIEEPVNKVVVFLTALIRPVIIDLEVIIRRTGKHDIEVINGDKSHSIPVIYNYIVHIEVITQILYIPADI